MLDLLFPTTCVLCGHNGPPLCIECLSGLPPAPDLAPPPGFDAFGALLSYEGETRRLIAAIKFQGHSDAIELPARVLAELVEVAPDVVTWAPTSRQRQRQRGYDQAELIARTVSQSLGCQCLPTLQRNAASGDSTGDHQTGRSRRERLAGASFAFGGSGVGTRGVDPHRLGSVLVVDDIRTTGATLSAAGDTLLEAGATSVSGLTLAVTL